MDARVERRSLSVAVALAVLGVLVISSIVAVAAATYKYSHGTEQQFDDKDIRGSRATLSCDNCRGYNYIPVSIGYSQVQVETASRLGGWTDSTSDRLMIYGKAHSGNYEAYGWRRFAYYMKESAGTPTGVWLGPTTGSSEERFAVYWSDVYCGDPGQDPPCLNFLLDNTAYEYAVETDDWEDGDDRAYSGAFILLEGIGPGPNGEHSYRFDGYTSEDNVWIRYPVESTPSNNDYDGEPDRTQDMSWNSIGDNDWEGDD